MSSQTERFSYRDGPFAKFMITDTVTGTAFSNLGTPYTPMISHTGAPQFCDPDLASAAKQGTLDAMSRLVISGCRGAGTDPGSWDIQVNFSRLASPEKQLSVILTTTLALINTDSASAYTVLDTTLPRDFMKARTGTVTAADKLTMLVECRPSDDLIDTAVCFDIMLCPGNATNEDRGRLVPA